MLKQMNALEAFIQAVSRAFLFIHDSHESHKGNKVFGSPITVTFIEKASEGIPVLEMTTPKNRTKIALALFYKELGTRAAAVLDTQKDIDLLFSCAMTAHDDKLCLPKNWNPWIIYDNPVKDMSERVAFVQDAWRKVAAHAQLGVRYVSLFGQRTL